MGSPCWRLSWELPPPSLKQPRAAGIINPSLQVKKLKLGIFHRRDKARILTPTQLENQGLESPGVRNLSLKRFKKKTQTTK